MQRLPFLARATLQSLLHCPHQALYKTSCVWRIWLACQAGTVLLDLLTAGPLHTT